MRRLAAFLWLICWGMVALADEAPRLVDVTPSLVGDQIMCRLQTMGVPGDKQLQSMRSGLESAVEVTLAVVDENDKLMGGRSVSLRMAFDLWEEVFSVGTNGEERRFQSLADLQAYLGDLGHLSVGSSKMLAPDGRYRIKAQLVVHAIAPDEQKRVEDVIAGEQRPRREGQDQQEASVSLGRLIRLFYKGGGDGRDGQELLSAWFTKGELADETH